MALDAQVLGPILGRTICRKLVTLMPLAKKKPVLVDEACLQLGCAIAEEVIAHIKANAEVPVTRGSSGGVYKVQ